MQQGQFPVLKATGTGRYLQQQLLFTVQMQASEIYPLLRALRHEGLDFMVHGPIPDNHYFCYHLHKAENSDFNRRLHLYADFASPWVDEKLPWEVVTEIVVIEPEHTAESCFAWLSENCPRHQIIRATSPLDHRSGWLEIFPAHISKAQTSAWLLERHALCAADALAIGNDYNDLEMLTWAGTARVVANAPESLRQRFPVVSSHCQDGVADAVSQWLALSGRSFPVV